jgi:hypothetical protein
MVTHETTDTLTMTAEARPTFRMEALEDRLAPCNSGCGCGCGGNQNGLINVGDVNVNVLNGNNVLSGIGILGVGYAS